MTVNGLDARIDEFLQRKYTTYPELAASGRNDSRTVKYALKLRASGQIVMAH